jgi:hypothetical protein
MRAGQVLGQLHGHSLRPRALSRGPWPPTMRRSRAADAAFRTGICGRVVVRTEGEGEEASVVAGEVQGDHQLLSGPAAVGQGPCGVPPTT